MTFAPHALDFGADPFDAVPLAAVRPHHDAFINLELYLPSCRVRQRHTAAHQVIATARERYLNVRVNSHDLRSAHRSCRGRRAPGAVRAARILTGYRQRAHNTWGLRPHRCAYAPHVRGGTADAPRSVNRLRD